MLWSDPVFWQILACVVVGVLLAEWGMSWHRAQAEMKRRREGRKPATFDVTREF